MWKIKSIDEADYGCEERMPGEPLLVFVTLESEDGAILQFEMPENWLVMQELDIGDEWPEDIDGENPEKIKAQRQNDWFNAYNESLESL